GVVIGSRLDRDARRSQGCGAAPTDTTLCPILSQEMLSICHRIAACAWLQPGQVLPAGRRSSTGAGEAPIDLRGTQQAFPTGRRYRVFRDKSSTGMSAEN